MKRPTKDKSKALKNARDEKREVIWLDKEGFWHAATNRANTPNWAAESEDVK